MSRLLAKSATCIALLVVTVAASQPALGTPSFGAAGDAGAGADFGFQKSAIAAGDLTGDGVPDVTMAGIGIGALRLTGDPASGAQTLPIGADEFTDIFFDEEISEFLDVGIAQLSGDDRPDIIGVGDGGARRFVQTSSGEFDPDGARLLQTDLRALAIGRVDGDALHDVVVVGSGGGWVMRRQAGGGLAAPQLVVGTAGLTDVVLGDFGGDPRTDIAVAGTTGVRVLLQSGTFSFPATAGSPIVTGSIESIAAGPFDAGATLDLAASRPGDDQVLIRLGRGDAAGTFDAGPSAYAGDNPGAMAAADLDLNGTTDLVVARLDRGDPDGDSDFTDIHNKASVLSGTGSGTFSLAATIDVFRAGQLDQMGNDVRSIAVADLDRDGRPDVLFADRALSAAIVARNSSIVAPPDDGRGGGGTGPGGGARSSGVTTGPGLTVTFARRQALSLRAGIVVSARCAAACTLTASGRISLRPRARKKITLGRVTRTLRAGETARMALAIPRRRWAAIGRALARGSRVRATVVITAKDARGTRATETLAFRLVPRRPGRG